VSIEHDYAEDMPKPAPAGMRRAERRPGALSDLDEAVGVLHDTITTLMDDLGQVLRAPESEDPSTLSELESGSDLRGRVSRVRDATERLQAIRRRIDL
jgi:hypothetical protein